MIAMSRHEKCAACRVDRTTLKSSIFGNFKRSCPTQFGQKLDRTLALPVSRIKGKVWLRKQLDTTITLGLGT
jgi:hypothetical protein